MRILLLGEFSSLYKNLKAGLEALGHEVITASSGDGYKKIPSDIRLNSNFPGLIGRVISKLNPIFKIRDFEGFDVVQVVNPFVFYHPLFPNKYFYKRLISKNSKFFISGAGDDAYFWRFGRSRLKYGPFDDFLHYDLKRPSYYLESDKCYNFNKWLLGVSNGLIPIMYEYEVSYEEDAKKLDTVPIPINMQDIEYRDNIVRERLVIFHGLNRYGFKGTRHVEAAFEYLSRAYPDDLELIIDGNLPLHEYLNIMERSNVVIDQMHSHSLGVNGLYAMAMGKVVIGGAEPESLESHKVTSSPAINVKPSSQDLIRVIENLLERKLEIQNIGKASRKYVENVHDSVHIARKYLEIWSAN
ncbi:MAG: glycosyltransferase [Plesiomonas shigelloides]